MESVIKGWLNSAIRDIIKQGALVDAHIDEFYNGKLETSEQLFDVSCAIFKIIKNEVSRNVEHDLQLEVRIELESESSSLRGVVRTFEELLDSIDLYSMPEVVISKPRLTTGIPVIESYRCPLPFNIGDFTGDVSMIYDEYRTIEEYQREDNFYRWITILCFCKH